jgi:hypothetical protein
VIGNIKIEIGNSAIIRETIIKNITKMIITGRDQRDNREPIQSTKIPITESTITEIAGSTC